MTSSAITPGRTFNGLGSGGSAGKIVWSNKGYTSDLIVGLPPGLAEQLDQEDAEWRINGQRGVIQFVK